MAPRQAAYQQIPANEPDNSDGNVVLPESVVDFSFGDGGTKRGLQERQWVIRTSLWQQFTDRLRFIACL